MGWMGIIARNSEWDATSNRFMGSPDSRRSGLGARPKRSLKPTTSSARNAIPSTARSPFQTAHTHPIHALSGRFAMAVIVKDLAPLDRYAAASLTITATATGSDRSYMGPNDGVSMN